MTALAYKNTKIGLDRKKIFIWIPSLRVDINQKLHITHSAR